MEHIPIPKHPTRPHLQIPYVCEQQYAGGPFEDYPARRSINVQALLTQSNPPSITNRLDRFFQEWLFFGLINEMYGGSPVTDTDFISRSPEGVQVLDTSKLNDFARLWIQNGSHADSLIQGMHVIVYYKIAKNIMWTSKGLLDPRTTWSICALLSHVAAVVGFRTKSLQKYPDSFPITPTDTGILGDLKSICTAEVSRMIRMGPMSLYYASRLPGRRLHLNDPQTCTELGCLKQNVAVGGYETKHHYCGGRCGIVSVDRSRLCGILQRGAIPGVSISRRVDNDAFQLEVVECSTIDGYVAISHVWADGMGNETDNALPMCQIQRLSHLLLALRTRHNTPLVFWMDTLCCPTKPREIRNLAISSMRRTYEGAAAELVLDSSLQVVNIRGGVDDLEIMTRIALSTWQQRLWTLQEGYLAQKLYFQFHDDVYDLDDGYTRLGAIEERWRIPLVGPLLASILEVRGKRLDPEFIMHPRAIPSLVFWASSLRHRGTTMAGDEASCLATLLEFSESSIRTILEVPRADVAARMKRFWQANTDIPPQIIFNRAPRLDHQGFRWAPRSFLQTESNIPPSWESAPRVELTECGLYVSHSPGYILEIPRIEGLQNHDWRDSQQFVFQDKDGNWFVAFAIYTQEQARAWWNSDVSRRIALVLKDNPREVARGANGILMPDAQCMASLALACDDRSSSPPHPSPPPPSSSASSSCVPRSHESIANTPESLSSSPPRGDCVNVQSIGVAYVGQAVGRHAADLDFIRHNRHLNINELIAERTGRQLRDASVYDQRYYGMLSHMFHDIRAEAVNTPWCFT